MAEPFRPAPAKSSIRRALRSKRTSTFEAIEDLLAASTSVRAVSHDAVAAVCTANDVDLERSFASERRHLYRRYLAYCLEDRALSEDENLDLLHLRLLLRLSDEDVAAVHDEVAREVYGKALQEVLADLKIDAEEEAFLHRLRDALHVSDEAAAELLEHGQYRARDIAVRRASSPDAEFAVDRLSLGEFTGRSADTFENAVADALEKARIAIPRLDWFEVTQIAGYVGEGKPSGWHVTVRCGMNPSANI